MPSRSNRSRRSHPAADIPLSTDGLANSPAARRNVHAPQAAHKADQGKSTSPALLNSALVSTPARASKIPIVAPNGHRTGTTSAAHPRSATTSARAAKTLTVRWEDHGTINDVVTQRKKEPAPKAAELPAATSSSNRAVSNAINPSKEATQNKHRTRRRTKARGPGSAPTNAQDRKRSGGRTSITPSDDHNRRCNANINAHRLPVLVVTDDQGRMLQNPSGDLTQEQNRLAHAGSDYEDTYKGGVSQYPSDSTADGAASIMHTSQQFLEAGRSAHKNWVELVSRPLLRVPYSLPRTSTRTSVAVYGRSSSWVDYLDIPQEDLKIQMFHPIERSTLPQDLTLGVAKHLYQVLRIRQAEDTKSWARDADDAAFVTHFETRQMSLSALQIWMWTHPDLSARDQREAEQARTAASMNRWPQRIASRRQAWNPEGAVMDVTQHDYANYLEKHYDFKLLTDTRTVDSFAGEVVTTALVADAPRFTKVNVVDAVSGKARSVFLEDYMRELAQEHWETGVVQGQTPYQPGEGSRSPTRSELGNA